MAIPLTMHAVNPITPAGNQLEPECTTPYDVAKFTLPSPRYISPRKEAQLLDGILKASPQHLQRLEADLAARLPEVRRLKKAANIGFFNQGIMTGMALVLATAVTCTAILGYYGTKFVCARQAHFTTLS